MTTVPVLWVSRHPEVLARGYADQGMLEALLDRTLWRPPDPIEFVHRDPTREDDWPIVGEHGAVVVLPSRHHVADIDWFCSQLDRLAWSVVMLTSEEEWEFDWQRVLAPNRRLWVWQGRPEHAAAGCRLMPCGWYQDRPDTIAATGIYTRTDQALDDSYAAENIMLEKPWDWFYGGQVTHERKQACADVLRGLRLSTNGKFIATDSYFAQPLSLREYLLVEAGAKVVPCPSGPESLCTARVEEALEAGCVPVVDLLKPKGDQWDYWSFVFPGYPWPALTDWSDFPRILGEVLADWPALVNRCSAYWQRWKREKAHQLDQDCRDLMREFGGVE